MITINLLPKERRQSSTNWLLNIAIVLISLVLVTVVCLATLGANVLAVASQARINHLEAQIEELEPILAKADELESKKAVLDEKEQIIETLVGRRIRWGQKLNELARLIPKDVWLEGVELETKYVIEKVEPPPSKRNSRRPTKPKRKEIRSDYLHIYAVTNDLERKSALQGELIRRLQTADSFYSDFVEVDFRESREENWYENDEESPMVWRFQVTLTLREIEPPRIL